MGGSGELACEPGEPEVPEPGERVGLLRPSKFATCAWRFSGMRVKQRGRRSRTRVAVARLARTRVRVLGRAGQQTWNFALVISVLARASCVCE